LEFAVPLERNCAVAFGTQENQLLFKRKGGTEPCIFHREKSIHLEPRDILLALYSWQLLLIPIFSSHKKPQIRNQCKKIERQKKDISTIAPEQRKLRRDAEEKKLGGHVLHHG